MIHDRRELQHVLQLVYSADSQDSARPPHSVSLPVGQSFTHLLIAQSTYHLPLPVTDAVVPVVDFDVHAAWFKYESLFEQHKAAVVNI